MNNIEQNIQILKDNGLDSNKIEQLFKLCMEDFLLELSEDIVELPQEDQQEINKTFDNISLGEILNNEKNPIVEVMKKVYGMSARNKLITFIDTYFQEAVEQLDQIKSFVKKLENKDPEALAKYQEALNDPDTKELEKMMKDLE